MYRKSPIIRWRKYNDRYQLIGSKCKSCNKYHYPKTALCDCGSKDFDYHKFSGKGKLLTFTEISSAPTMFSEKTPYCIGVVELEEGPRIGAQIVDTSISELKIDQDVEAVFRKFYASGSKGAIHYGTKFVTIK